GETPEARADALRSVAQSGYVPAARVAGRPEGWGAGRAGTNTTNTELQLRLDFDAVKTGGDAPAAGPERPFEPAEDLPAALAAARRWPRRPTGRATAGRRLRHPDRRVHPERRPAQPDDRRCGRRAPRPDPALGDRSATDGPRGTRSLVCDGGP